MPESISHISTSGGLFPVSFVQSLRELNVRQAGIEPHTFTLPWSDAGRTPAALEETIAAAWELLLERWDAVRAAGAGAHHDLQMLTVSEIRNRWLLPLFQLLDFDPQYLRGDTVLDEAGELRFPLSHRGWQQAPHGPAPILHTEAPAQGLDARAASGRGTKAKSPHDMLQLYLNLSRDDRWALLGNGLILRLLRDYHHTFSKGYVQFDLEAIFETRNYGDFRALFRLCHASRFFTGEDSESGEGGKDGEETETGLAPIEQLYRTAQAAGVKVGEDLRGQVRQAIEILGNGFLQGASVGGTALHSRLQDDADMTQQFYAGILRVIYRILFLLFAEQRGLLPHAGAPLEELYSSQYSISALRRRAEGLIPRWDEHTDLWHGLQATFHMVRKGAPQLGVFGYNGMLFDDDEVRSERQAHVMGRASPSGQNGAPSLGNVLLANHAIPNSALLQAMRRLTLVERDGVLVRISYADLGVEELGSIYESLLDYTPRVTREPEHVEGRDIAANTFFLDPRGLQRKSSGSYYTHPALVNELIHSALLPVMRDRLQRAGLPVLDEGQEEASEAAAAGALLRDYAALGDEQRAAGGEALLALNVCDPAAGSGHFLVKANNALAAELARIRSGDDYPTEAAIALARRDVLAHCIYAVDLNPMAVELCKVSLWINASVADRPLSFLDHHIKLGNSLIGATPELLKDGVPYDAFALGRAGDDREVAKAFRARNRQERRDYENRGGAYQMKLRYRTLRDAQPVYEVLQQVEAQSADHPNDARNLYAQYQAMDHTRRLKLEADLWTAAFFWPLPEGTTWAPTFAEFMRLRNEGPEALPAERLAQVQALAEEHRFFHWYLEFPEVLGDEHQSGFDVVVGNPPWEKVQPEERTFFIQSRPDISAATGSKRKRLIKKLQEQNPILWRSWINYKSKIEMFSEFMRSSQRYPLSAVGNLNTATLFTDLAYQLIGHHGKVGILVPSVLATNALTADFFSNLVDNGAIQSLYDFENRLGHFADVHSSFRFCLLTLSGTGHPIHQADYSFFLTDITQISEEHRHFSLTEGDLELLSPNTKTAPTFQTKVMPQSLRNSTAKREYLS